MDLKFRSIIVLLIVSVAIFGVYNVRELENEIEKNQYNQLINDLSKVTINFSTWISTKKEMIKTTKDFVDNFSYEEITKDRTSNRFLNINNDDPDVSQVYIGLADGNFVTGGLWVPPDDYDPRQRVWYEDAISEDDTVISPIYTDRETGDQLVTISSPLYIDEVFVGVISADVFLNNINSYLENQIYGNNIYAYLLDDQGDIIVHTKDSNLVGLSIYDDLDDNKVMIDYFEKVRQTDEIVDMEYVFDEKNIKGITQKVKNVDWYLGVAIEEEGVVNALERVDKDTLIFNVFVTIIIVLLIYLIIKIKKELEIKNKVLTIGNKIDFLTGIYNRRYFNQWLDKIWEEAMNSKEISLLMMDLDYFKEYNDYYGHVKGDEVLKKVTKIINDLTREGDVFARYGGEEFALILSNVTLENAEKVAEKIRLAIEAANIPHEKSILSHLTISIGVSSIIPSDASRVRSFIHRTDQALYKAKNNGRNCIAVDRNEEDH
jgi:diguanylate cyclase (GGDEF)-like protein